MKKVFATAVALLCTATLHRHHDHAVGSCSAAGLPFGLRRVVTAAYRGDRNFRFSRHSAAVTRR